MTDASDFEVAKGGRAGVGGGGAIFDAVRGIERECCGLREIEIGGALRVTCLYFGLRADSQAAEGVGRLVAEDPLAGDDVGA